MDNLKRTENFFVEGSGKAHVLGENGKYSLIHLQDMSIELTAKMEDIFGGEGIFDRHGQPCVVVGLYPQDGFGSLNAHTNGAEKL